MTTIPTAAPAVPGEHTELIADDVPSGGTFPATPAGHRALTRISDGCNVVAIVFSGAIFGIFYAWVSTTMWGLDNADPRIAIEAMQEMNAAIRNAAFFPVFFLTPGVLGVAALLARRAERRRAVAWFVAAAVVYVVGCLAVTGLISVPMNDDLAEVVVPTSRSEAESVWVDYSGRWQFWNLMRTIACGVSLVLATVGVRRAAR